MIQLRKILYLFCLIFINQVCVTDATLKNNNIVLTGTTSRPEMSTFALGDAVNLFFKVDGLEPQADLKLQIQIVDIFDKVIQKKEVKIPAITGEWKYTMPAPAGRYGFYRVYAKLSNGVTLPAMGSRKAGQMSYCVVYDPAKRILYPADQSRFGIQGGFNKAINVLPYLGIRWIIGGFQWHQMEPNYSGEYAEKCKKAAAQGMPPPGVLETSDWYYVVNNGKKMQWQLYSIANIIPTTPRWAGIPETYGNLKKFHGTAALTSEGEMAFDRYCREVARVFSSVNNASDRYYQITWEPNNPWAYNGTDKQLIRIYEIAYKAIHEIDSKAHILGVTLSGAFSEEGLEAHKRLFKQGLGKYVDGVSVHAYKKTPEDGDIQIRKFQTMVKRQSGRDLPVYITEQGFITHEKQELELEQAVNIVWNNLISLGEGIPLNITFYITDYAGEPGYGFYYNLHPRKIFGTNITSPKPVAAAYAAMTALLDGHTPIGPVEWLGATIKGYAYELNNRITLALWNTGNSTSLIKLPVGTDKIKLYDWMGNSLTPDLDNKILTLNLGQTPIYIQNVSELLWGRSAARKLTVRSEEHVICPGKTLNLRADIRMQAREAVSATLILQGASGIYFPAKEMKINIPPGHDIYHADFTLKIPENIPLGVTPLKLSLMESNKVVAVNGLMLDVKAPLDIKNLRPIILPDKSWGVSVHLQETAGNAFEGTIDLRLKGVPSLQNSMTVTCAPNQSKDVIFPIKTEVDPLRMYNCKLTLKENKGRKYSFEFPVNFFKTQLTNRKISIDGDIDDWRDFPFTEIKGASHLVRSEKYYAGSWDSSIRFSSCYDATNLYLAFDVDDDLFIQNWIGCGTWQGDSIQMGFNLDPYKKEQNSGNGLLDRGTKARKSLIDIALTKQGCSAYRNRTYNSDVLPIGTLTNGQVNCCIKKKQDNAGLIYEVAIPWKALGAGDSIPEIFGFAFSVNDRDAVSPEQRDPSALGFFDGISDFNTGKFAYICIDPNILKPEICPKDTTNR